MRYIAEHTMQGSKSLRLKPVKKLPLTIFPPFPGHQSASILPKAFTAVFIPSRGFRQEILVRKIKLNSSAFQMRSDLAMEEVSPLFITGATALEPAADSSIANILFDTGKIDTKAGRRATQ